jgi:hypothetical protein
MYSAAENAKAQLCTAAEGYVAIYNIVKIPTCSTKPPEVISLHDGIS